MNILLAGITITILIASVQSFGYDNRASLVKKWDYEVLGPDVWFKQFPDCKLKSQSPIDIHSGDAVYDPTLTPLHFNGQFKFETDWVMTKTTHGVYINVANGNTESTTVTGGNMRDTPFETRGAHFHWGYNDHQGSEHQLNGKKYPLEMHMVTQDHQGNYRVVGYFFEIGKQNNTGFEPIIEAVRNIEKSENQLTFGIDFSNIVPNDKANYYSYKGSFTTPPCTEGVVFHIMKETIKISQKQLEAFHGLELKLNFREPQPLNERELRKSFLSSTSFTCNTFTECIYKLFDW